MSLFNHFTNIISPRPFDWIITAEHKFLISRYKTFFIPPGQIFYAIIFLILFFSLFLLYILLKSALSSKRLQFFKIYRSILISIFFKCFKYLPDWNKLINLCFWSLICTDVESQASQKNKNHFFISLHKCVIIFHAW